MDIDISDHDSFLARLALNISKEKLKEIADRHEDGKPWVVQVTLDGTDITAEAERIGWDIAKRMLKHLNEEAERAKADYETMLEEKRRDIAEDYLCTRSAEIVKKLEQFDTFACDMLRMAEIETDEGAAHAMPLHGTVMKVPGAEEYHEFEFGLRYIGSTVPGSIVSKVGENSSLVVATSLNALKREILEKIDMLQALNDIFDEEAT